MLAGGAEDAAQQTADRGHTDAAQYSTNANYSNWELSADRANSARRLLQQDGVRPDQVTQVRGFADQMLRVKNNPYDPSNRRITILVKNSKAVRLRRNSHTRELRATEPDAKQPVGEPTGDNPQPPSHSAGERRPDSHLRFQSRTRSTPARASPLQRRSREF